MQLDIETEETKIEDGLILREGGENPDECQDLPPVHLLHGLNRLTTLLVCLGGGEAGLAHKTRVGRREKGNQASGSLAGTHALSGIGNFVTGVVGGVADAP